MTIEEIRKKDWQVMTAYNSIQEIAFLKTIMENQAVIIALLTNKSSSETMAEVENRFEANYKVVDATMKRDVPDYPDLH